MNLEIESLSVGIDGNLTVNKEAYDGMLYEVAIRRCTALILYRIGAVFNVVGNILVNRVVVDLGEFLISKA